MPSSWLSVLHKSVVRTWCRQQGASRARTCALTCGRLRLLSMQMFDVQSGRLVRTLGGGHFDTVNCCK